MTWPLELEEQATRGAGRHRRRREKKAFIERQMKEQFYNWPASEARGRPSSSVQHIESGDGSAVHQELTWATIAGVIGRRSKPSQREDRRRWRDGEQQYS